MDRCSICNSPTTIYEKTNEFDTHYIVNCHRCGRFRIEEEVLQYIIDYEIENDGLNSEQIANISGWIRDNQGLKIHLDLDKFLTLMTLRSLSVSEKANMVLKFLAKQHPVAGMKIQNSLNDFGIARYTDEMGRRSYTISTDLLPLFGVCRIVNSGELMFIWEEYLIKTKKLISSERPRIITPSGWAYLESLRQANPDSKKAFVAMWFDSGMEIIYDEFISKAIMEEGFEPIQIGRKEHNNDINDEIIGEIRNCKFVVADFTGNRGGVYYEAGFAYGLNIEVIHTCQEDQLKDVHFDINHRNIIKWSDGEDLYNKLLKRIKATIT
jgi:hypothetical protein